MKRILLLTTLCVLAGLLLTGCEQKQPAPKPVKKVKVAKAKPEPKQKPVKQPVAVQPGTLQYLDAKNGFRDVDFGVSSDSLTGLVPVSEDAARRLKTFTRTGDELSLGDVPLQKIEYTFFDDKLCQVSLSWNIEFRDNAQRIPPPTDISAFCGTLYGRPTRHNVAKAAKDASFYVWQGKRTEALMTEARMTGVPNVVNGGWTIPPTTSGKMVISSVPLERNAIALNASQTAQNSGGL